MQKSITFSQRVNTILALAIVFLLVLATNRIDQKHFETAQKAVNEVFKDRVLVQGYIFSISNTLRAKQLALTHGVSESKAYRANAEIDTLIKKFQDTRLTRTEAQLLSNFKTDFKKLKQLESAPSESVDTGSQNQILNAMQDKLESLSEIQIHESRSLTRGAQKSLDLSALLSNIELLFVIIIGVVLQILMFYRSKKIAQQSTQDKA